MAPPGAEFDFAGPVNKGLTGDIAALLDAPYGEQADALVAMLRSNPHAATILERAPELRLPDWYLAAGAVAQTVWNVLHDRDAREGINDYDLVYFDSSDRSREAEDGIRDEAASAFAELPVRIDVRNQARVHLWYADDFGVPAPPYRSSVHAISTFPTFASAVGVRREPGGSYRVSAPFGLTDLLEMRVRHNAVLAPRWVFERKVTRWRAQWPQLTVL